jgi:hypothetical protein
MMMMIIFILIKKRQFFFYLLTLDSDEEDLFDKCSFNLLQICIWPLTLAKSKAVRPSLFLAFTLQLEHSSNKLVDIISPRSQQI